MARFQTTRWSLIDAAHAAPPVARPALERLCRDYRPPVLSYIRHSGYPSHEAEDLTQAFFLHVLEHGWYANADPARGRFRALLLTSLRRFLADRAAQARAAKRGGGVAHAAEWLDDVPDTGSPEDAFMREWLAATLDRAMAALRNEWAQAGKAEQFARLAPLLADARGHDALHRTALDCGLRGNTLSVQLHRMRQRLRQLVRLEVMQTVDDRAALEVELAELRTALDTLA